MLNIFTLFIKIYKINLSLSIDLRVSFFRWFTFLDGGQVFNPQDGENITFNDMRFSTGLGVSWISPVGPLKLSIGYPINPKPFDRTQRFQFQLGTGF